MRNNKTSQPAERYDSKINMTIPYYEHFLEQTLDLVSITNPSPNLWLDTGCGTGTLAQKAIQKFPDTKFVLSDPSEAMLLKANEKLDEFRGKIKWLCNGSENLVLPSSSFDIITSIISHHYFDKNTRKHATKNCYRMLTEGGLYVTFETIKPSTNKGVSIGLERWKQTQIRNGKSLTETKHHLDRYGVEIFPISIDCHFDLLKAVGFSLVEIFWFSFLQAGFYAIK